MEKVLGEYREELKNIEFDSDISLDNLYIDYAVEYNDVLLDSGDSYIWGLFRDDWNKVVKDMPKVGEQDELYYEQTTKMEPENLVMLDKISYLMRSSTSLLDARLVDFDKVKTKHIRDLYQQPISYGRGEKWKMSTPDMADPTRYQQNELKRKGGKIKVVYHNQLF
jgi:hypothetical protein